MTFLCNSMMLSPQGSYLAETTTYIAATGASFSGGQKNAIDRWFKDLLGYSNGSYSTYNVLSRIKWIYPFLTGTYTADRVNAANPGIYNYTDTGSPTYSTSTLSVAYNGSSQFSNTNFTPNVSSTFAGSDFTGFGCRRVDTNADTNATMGEVGGGNSYIQIGGTLAANRIMNLCAKIADGTGSGTRNINGLWFCSWASSTSINSYYNGALMRNQTITYDNTPSRSIYLGAFNAGSTGYGGATTIDFAVAVTGAWTDNEAQLLYNATKALKASFGITWP